MNIGPHVGRHWQADRPLEEQIETVRQHANTQFDLDLRGFQVFVAGPRVRKMLINAEGEKSLRKYLKSNNIKLVAHGTYTDSPWTHKPHAIQFIKEELEVCFRSGICGLVIHLGVPGEDVVAEVLPKLVQTYFDSSDPEDVLTTPPRLYLENPHVKPVNSKYHTPEQLNSLYRLTKELDPHELFFGVCVDTAHLWSCGEDVSTYELAKSWLDRLEVPRKALIFHLNDSQLDLGAGIDHHAPLMSGQIWGKFADTPKLSGLWAFLEYAVEHDILTVLERTSKTDILAEINSDFYVLKHVFKL